MNKETIFAIYRVYLDFERYDQFTTELVKLPKNERLEKIKFFLNDLKFDYFNRWFYYRQDNGYWYEEYNNADYCNLLHKLCSKEKPCSYICNDLKNIPGFINYVLSSRNEFREFKKDLKKTLLTLANWKEVK